MTDGPTFLPNLIGGALHPAADGGTIDVVEPATGLVLARAAASSGVDVARAVDAARGAFPAWSGASAATRSRLLVRLADLLLERLDAFAAAESADSGKPIALARAVDIPRAAANLRYFAGALLHTSGETHASDGDGVPGAVPAINLTVRRPRGVAGCISPWNLPLYLLTWKIAPALATGNTVVAKPSEVTPLTAHMLGELASQAGFPPGVLNIVHGYGPVAGAALVTHPDVPTITFTGSTGVGRWIAREAGDALERVSLELGGKNAFIICADAELDGPSGAIATAARAAFSNQGQICLCGSRLLVHRSLYERVREDVAARARALRTGDPADPSTEFGSLVSLAHRAKVEAYVELARGLGGTIHAGGARPEPASLPARCRNGAYYLPTVIDGLPPGCRVEQEEIFGPVVTLQPFDDDDEALALANATRYGLAASVFTRDIGRAHRIAAAVDAGIVWVNCWMSRDLRTPFGGMKESGVGREGGSEALRFFTEPRNICISLD